MNAGSNAGYAIEGRQAHGEGIDLPDADIRTITPDYPATMGIPLIAGRLFTAQDRLGAPLAAIVDESFVRREFPGQDPLGKRFWCGTDDGNYTIVGVIADVRALSPAVAPAPIIYNSMAQHPYRVTDAQFIVRTRGEPAQMNDTLRQLLARTHPELAVSASTMEQNIGLVQQADRFRTTLFTLFACVSILLAAVGMYGVTAYSVAQRRFEFGLRVALGASRWQLLGMVLRGAGSVALLGIVLGVVLSLSLQRVLAGIVGKLPAFDAAAYLLASLAVLGITLVATLLPARRAASVDPMQVLRSE